MATANVIGKGFEYSTVNWINTHNKEGQVCHPYESLRNPLSGANAQISAEIGLYDIRVWTSSIFLQIELKKTMKNVISLDKIDWIGKLNMANDELLVFAYNRSDRFALISLERYLQIAGKYLKEYDNVIEAKGERYFKLDRKLIEDNIPALLVWGGQKYIILDFGEFLAMRYGYKEQSKHQEPAEFIKSTYDVIKLKEWYIAISSVLSTREQYLYWSKLNRLETGKSLLSDTFYGHCPHCHKEIKGTDFHQN